MDAPPRRLEIVLAVPPDAVILLLTRPERYLPWIPDAWGAGSAWMERVRVAACVESGGQVRRFDIDQRALWACFWEQGEAPFLSATSERHRQLRLEAVSAKRTRVQLRAIGCGLCAPAPQTLHESGSLAREIDPSAQELAEASGA